MPCLQESVSYAGWREFIKGEVSFIFIFVALSPNIGTQASSKSFLQGQKGGNKEGREWKGLESKPFLES